MIPTAYGRHGDRLLLHGAAGNGVLRAAAAGASFYTRQRRWGERPEAAGG